MNRAAPSLLSAALTLICVASSAASTEPVTWKLADTAKVGGHQTEVLGSPRAIAVDGRPAFCFNGTSDGVIVSNNPIAGWPQFTIEALMKPDANGGEEQRFFHIEDERSTRMLFETRLTPEHKWALDTFLYKSATDKRALLDREKLHDTAQWHWVALTYDGKTMTHYVNGVHELDGPVTFDPMANGRVSLGVRMNQRSWYHGCIAEVRFTPRALPSSELARERPSS
jgi:hypothetical protein